MPANSCNYLVIYKNSSQVFGTASKDVALSSPPPDGSSVEDKQVLFITYEPDSGDLVYYKLPDEDVHGAEIKRKSGKVKNSKEDDF